LNKAPQHRRGSATPRAGVGRHFLTGEELEAPELEALLGRAAELKRSRAEFLAGGDRPPLGAAALAAKTVALFFEIPSTRTRVSFQVGVNELGGHPLPLRADELQLGRGESIADTARILSGYLQAIVIRSGSHETVVELAEAATVPVINALTPLHHPCQALADLLTLRERFGALDHLKLAYVGDGNNVARSLAILGRIAGVEVRVATPPGYELEPGLAALDTHDAREAASGADALYTDVWVSMGDELDAERRRADLGPYQLNEELLGHAAERAIALHCLPAHPGEEISAGVLYGERSAVWDQAENRLHAQKALLELLAGG
jgi:ornithine carbamoyltransferase